MEASVSAATAARWSDLRKRALSAAVLAPVALAGIWRGETAFWLMIGVACVGLGIEWTHMCGRRVISAEGGLSLLVILAGYGLAVAGYWHSGLEMLATGTLLVAIIPGVRPRWFWAGVPYIGVSAISLYWLRHHLYGRFDVLFLVLLVWATDIGAYVAGRVIGGAKLAPRISPSKTWAGAIGGLAAAVVVACLAVWFVYGARGMAVVVLLAAVLAVSSEAGDLFESWLKRLLGVKDSGRLIPGHGGLLDRLDGLMAAAPVMALLMLILGHGEFVWR